MNKEGKIKTYIIIGTIVMLLAIFSGITFAYFTALNNTGSTSVISATSGKMTINYADGSSRVLLSEDIQPSSKIIIDKTFTLTGTNTTSGLVMPYKVNLKYNSGFSNGMIHYYLKVLNTDSDITVNLIGTPNQTIPGNETEIGYTTGTLNLGNLERTLVYGEFSSNSKDKSITFNLKLQFPDNGENQDSEKGKTINAEVIVNSTEMAKVVDTKYYTTLVDAIKDANQDIVTNGTTSSTGAKAKIDVYSDDTVIVSPLEDTTINEVLDVGSPKGYTLDLNDKTITLTENNHFNEPEGTILTLDDSGTKGTVSKNVDATNYQYLFYTYGKLIINGGIYNNIGKGNIYTFYGKNSSITQNGGSGYVESNKMTVFLFDSGDIEITINNVNCQAKGIGSGASVCLGVQDAPDGKVVINGGTYNSDSEQGMARAANFYGTVNNVTINDGTFIADAGKYSNNTSGLYFFEGNITINNGYFRGISKGAELKDTANINGGTFESPYGGGLVLSGNVNVKNATIKLGTYKGKYHEMNNISYFSIFEIIDTYEAKVYMDNVTLVSDYGDVKVEIAAGRNDTYLYVSNTKFPGSIRVDGTRSDSTNPTSQGHLYVGKNVTYNGIITGSGDTMGIVDTTTYADTEFLK